MKNKVLNYVYLALFILVAPIVAAILFGIALVLWEFSLDRYETTDVADYGEYIGTFDDETVQEFINSFFPKEIDDSFTDISYSYRAQEGDSYAFEAYLEFTVEDKHEYDNFVAQYTEGIDAEQFRYHGDFTEYVIFDTYIPNSLENSNGGIDRDKTHGIEYAKIAKILCSDSEQRIIFVAMGVYDGGGADVDFLSVYFDRFRIDPYEYANHSERIPEIEG